MLVKEMEILYNSSMSGLDKENNNGKKGDGAKKWNKSLLIVVPTGLFIVRLVCYFISGFKHPKWDKFNKVAAILTPIFTSILSILWTWFFTKPGFIEKIGNYIWGLFFDRVITTKEVQPYYKQIGDRIIEAQRERNFYGAIYPTRSAMFNHKKLYKEPGKKITYISMSGEYLSNDCKEVLEQLENKKIIIFVLNPLSDCAKKRVDELKKSNNGYNLVKDVKATVERFYDIINSGEFTAKKYNDFQLYQYDSLPYMSGVVFEREEGKVEYYRGCCKTSVLQQQPLKNARFVRL
jgi:hypothetical protein